MAFIVADRVQETATANTTVSFTLTGAIASYQSFSAIGDTNTTYYGATDGTNWEVGLGTYSTTGPTLTRTTILSSSNSGSAATFSGAVTVWCDYPAGKQISSDYPNALGVVTPAAVTATTITGQTATIRNTQNLIRYSEDLSNGSAWGGDGTTASIISTSFASNTSQLVQTSSAYWNQNATGVTGAINGKTYTISAWIWSTTSTGTIGLRAAASGGGSGTNLTVTLTSTPTRYSVSFTYTSSDSFPQITFDNRSGQGGDGVAKTYLVWGAQIEEAPSVGTYVKTTTAAIYNVPSLSFNGVSTISLDQSGNLSLQPAGTGALQAQATTSSTVGGNARGANAVDWQTLRDTAAKVASGTSSVLCGGQYNQASGVQSVVVGGNSVVSSGSQTFSGGGSTNTNSAQLAFLGGGYSNNISSNGQFGVLGGGYSNTLAGFYNVIGGGFTNSGTSGSAVTTQSGTMNATTAVTLSGSNASIKVGQLITGTSIQSFPATYVAAISGTALTLSQVASGSSTSTLSFFTPHGVVVGGGNNQATGSYSFIGGGGDAGTAANRNVASGDWSAVLGGFVTKATGLYSVSCGGNSNTASGAYSAVVSGQGNTASNTHTFIGGGAFHTASGSYSSVVGGYGNTSTGDSSVVIGGVQGTTRGISGNQVSTGNNNAFGTGTLGGIQSGLLVLGKVTTDATATVLSSNNSAASTTNQVILPNNSAYTFKGTLIANVTGGGDTSSWEFRGAIKRGANAASTVLVGTPRIDNIGYNAGASTWTFTLTADTTNGGLAITVTGAASTTIRWVAKVETTEVTY
jgi:hypothetical protein